MKRIAIIPARGGSKRIPRKNIKNFIGKPIIAYSIEAALSSNLFDEVMVSTEDIEIAEIAQSFGASIPFKRTQKNADDYATTISVLLEVLEAYENIRGEVFENVCCLYPTAPFVTSTKLADSLKIMNQDAADSIVPVVKYSFPPQRGFVITDGKLEYREPKYINSRSQDLCEIYHDAGQFYWSRVEGIQSTRLLANGVCLPFELSEMEVQDIDSEDDWELAVMKYKHMICGHGG